MKNKIKEILEKQGISILRFSEMLNQYYAPVYNLVHRETLNTTSLDTLNRVAKVLKVDIKDLYEEEKNEEI